MISVRKLPQNELRIQISDVFGFLGVIGEAKGELEANVKAAVSEAEPFLTPRACFKEYGVTRNNGALDLGFAVTQSRDLDTFLGGYEKIVLIAATVGIGVDRLVAKYSVTEPSRALIMQAVGSAAVEAFVDTVCSELVGAENAKKRFSCGYGDLELDLQKKIFEALACEKNIGLTLNSSMLMTPTKSVTAIIGLK